MSRDAKEEIELRLAVPEDWLALKSLLAESASEYWTPQQLETEFQRSASRIYLGTFREEIFGFCVMMLAADVADVLLIAVSPRLRKRGYGSIFLRSICREMKRLGASEVCLEVRETNVAAIRLYEKVGFTQVGKRKGYYGSDGLNAKVFRLSLTDCDLDTQGVR